MSQRKECIAMLLAGGRGSRLGILTKYRAKPAIPFGGKYRLIDFSLSNCINSGIDTVGVLTQYQAKDLSEYIGDGRSWDLDRLECGVRLLEPGKYTGGSLEYLGTADAVYQNIFFIDQYRPDYVVVLSGDHIYKMDYNKLLDFHKSKKADCTISTIDVPIDQATRFGILNIRDDYSVYEFEEKPPKPKSSLASMGIYVFSWQKLRAYLENDAFSPDSSHDFGNDLIPDIVLSGERVFAYPFSGYWRDVGTAESLWEANMDLLEPFSEIRRFDSAWQIYSNSTEVHPHFTAKSDTIINTLVTDHCTIAGSVYSSIIFGGVQIEKDAVIRNSVILPNAYICKNARVTNAIISENVFIGEDSIVGFIAGKNIRPRYDITVVGNGVKIGRKAVVTGTMCNQNLEFTRIV